MRFFKHSSQLATCTYEGPNVCVGNQIQIFMTIITALVNKRCIKQFCDKPKDLQSEYDFIVVGGGSAGAVVAARLSEIKDFSVLLIEAGPEEPLNALVPGMVASLLGSEVDWNLTTVNEPHACKKAGGKCSWPRGKNLGGNSVHNGMMYIRGNSEDYKRWNLSDWTYDKVLPYFIRSENNKEFKNKFHGVGGPLHVSKFPHQPAIAKDILLAAEQMGYGRSKDLNGEKITGFTIAQTTNAKGVRVSSATAFLRPVRERKNLHVLLKAEVSKLIFCEEDPLKVVGVEYYKNNERKEIKVKREVILSAGAIGSPHILLLSGIGPKDEISSNNIKLVKDLPGVGNNLQNHVSYTINFEVNDPESDLFAESVEQYKKDQTGPLSSTGLSQMTGIVPSSNTKPEYPDIQFYFRGYDAACSGSKSGKRQVGIVAAYLHPKSRGSLKLASNSYKDAPIITQNYLSHEDDLNGIIEGLEIALNISKADALETYGFKLVSDPIPQCKPSDIKSKDYWKCAIKYNTDPENHQGGSCKMGLPTDSEAVVDTKLKVIGVKGLRVADASVLPALTSGNIAAPIMMIGERVADFIKIDHAKPKGVFNKLLNKFPPMNKVLSVMNSKMYPYPAYLYSKA